MHRIGGIWAEIRLPLFSQAAAQCAAAHAAAAGGAALPQACAALGPQHGAGGEAAVFASHARQLLWRLAGPLAGRGWGVRVVECRRVMQELTARGGISQAFQLLEARVSLWQSVLRQCYDPGFVAEFARPLLPQGG